MARHFIVVGDSLSRGGRVVSGSPFTDIEGRPMARVGDRALCSKHGPATIITGDATVIIDGNAAARHGDWASCGCQLVAGQQSLVFTDSGESTAPMTRAPSGEMPPGPASGGPLAAPAPSAPSTLGSRGRAARVCWVNDQDIRVAANAHGRYYQVYGPGGDAKVFSMERRFRIDVPLHTAGDVEVTVKLKAVPVPGPPEAQATEHDIEAVKARMVGAIQQFWNGRFTLSVSDPQCGNRSFPIRYKVEWVTRGQDYTMNVYPSVMRAHVQSLRLNIWKGISAWTLAHEFAHCVGVADEYAYDPDEAWTLRYYAHDGTLHDEVVQLPPIKPGTDPTATIMSTMRSTATAPRHAWPIAFEAQRFLSAEIGRTITCIVT